MIIIAIEYICLIIILTASLRTGIYAVSSSPPPLESHEECLSSNYLCEDDDEDALVPMTFEEETVMVYVTPDVSSFYREDDADSSTRVLKEPIFDGFGIKVINMSPEPVTWWW